MLKACRVHTASCSSHAVQKFDVPLWFLRTAEQALHQPAWHSSWAQQLQCFGAARGSVSAFCARWPEQNACHLVHKRHAGPGLEVLLVWIIRSGYAELSWCVCTMPGLAWCIHANSCGKPSVQMPLSRFASVMMSAPGLGACRSH